MLYSGIFTKEKKTQGNKHQIILAHTAKVSYCKRFKILTPKQMIQRLPIALAQLKVVIHLKTY